MTRLAALPQDDREKANLRQISGRNTESLIAVLGKAVMELSSRVAALEKAERERCQAQVKNPMPTLPIERVMITKIIERAALAFGVPVSLITGADRRRVAVQPRHWVMYEASEAGFSTGTIGRVLGGRDHTTVMHGIRTERARRLMGAKK